MYPIVNLEKCTDCQLCVKDCVAEAIDKRTKEIFKTKCIHCGHCTVICPVEAIRIDGESGEVLNPISDNLSEDFESLIKNRRSIRFYKKTPVQREKIYKIVETVNCAPTGTNSRLVGMTVLDSQEKINHLSDIIMSHFDKITKILLNGITYPFLMLLMGSEKTKKLFSYQRIISSYNRENNILTHDAPLLFIFHSHKKSSVPAQDAVIWATTAMYFAESMGIGTCFNGFLVIGINTCKKARKYLNIPKGHKIYESFTAGYAEFSYNRGVLRKDLNVNFV
ncbi:MAG: nitroreductase family protein [Spirochaetaceae bacterium]|jgi:nitroreductase/NAD-dependent dihydropyrimidine dehydrogenase PreA subunit|nr:nitroreductase family protein [Spirochaetaceae bacterium]